MKEMFGIFVAVILANILTIIFSYKPLDENDE